MSVKTSITKKSESTKNNKTVDSVLRLLLSFDQSMRAANDHLDQLCIIGVDEVGIGCLAGPVVAAATILPLMTPQSRLAKSLSNLNDSKKLKDSIRRELSYFIHQNAHCSIASASVEEIDDLNILQAGFLAMKRAVTDLIAKLTQKPKNFLVLVDGNRKIPRFDYEQVCIIKGDSQSASIAAASVIAKVFRDNLMEQLSTEYPHYLWHNNKGYGSSAHRQAIEKHGLSIWHRRTFTKNLASLD